MLSKVVDQLAINSIVFHHDDSHFSPWYSIVSFHMGPRPSNGRTTFGYENYISDIRISSGDSDTSIKGAWSINFSLRDPPLLRLWSPWVGWVATDDGKSTWTAKAFRYSDACISCCRKRESDPCRWEEIYFISAFFESIESLIRTWEAKFSWISYSRMNMKFSY